jgi:hypothetical protein
LLRIFFLHRYVFVYFNNRWFSFYFSPHRKHTPFSYHLNPLNFRIPVLSQAIAFLNLCGLGVAAFLGGNLRSNHRWTCSRDLRFSQGFCLLWCKSVSLSECFPTFRRILMLSLSL